MALPRGEALVRHDRYAFTRHIWEVWNPGWAMPEAEFAATAPTFDNPDWADVVLHSYRVRWGHAPADPSYASTEARLAASRSAVMSRCGRLTAPGTCPAA